MCDIMKDGKKHALKWRSVLLVFHAIIGYPC